MNQNNKKLQNNKYYVIYLWNCYVKLAKKKKPTYQITLFDNPPTLNNKNMSHEWFPSPLEKKSK